MQDKISKHALENKEAHLKMPDFANPIQELIYLYTPLLVKSIQDSIKKHKHIGEFFGAAKSGESSRLFFQGIEDNGISEFDAIFSTCSFLRLAEMPNEKDFILEGKAAYILSQDALFYIDQFSKIHTLNVDAVTISKIEFFFPQDESVLKIASELELDSIKKLTKYSPLDIVAEVDHYFSILQKQNQANKFFKQAKKIIQFLYLPIQKSNAWIDFWSLQQKKLQAPGDYLKHLIEGAFAYKIMCYWKFRTQSLGLWNSTIKEQLEIFTKVCSYPTKKLFLNECKNILEWQTRHSLSHIILNPIVKTQEEKLESLEKIRDGLYFKLLAPQSDEIYEQEIELPTTIFHTALKNNRFPLKDQKSAELPLEIASPFRQKRHSFSLFSPRVSPKESQSTSSSSRGSPKGYQSPWVNSRSNSKLHQSPSLSAWNSPRYPSANQDPENLTVADSVAEPNKTISTTTTTTTSSVTAPISIPNSLRNHTTAYKEGEISPKVSHTVPRKISKSKTMTLDLTKLRKSDSPRSTAVSRPYREISPPRITFNKETGMNGLGNEKEEAQPRPRYYLNISGENIPAAQMGEMTIDNSNYYFFAVPVSTLATSFTLTERNEEVSGIFRMSDV